MKTLAAFFSILLIFAPGQSTMAQEATLTEWDVPWLDSRPRDPYVGPDGMVWFVGQRSDYIAKLDPASGDFTKFDLDPGAGPHNCIVDDEGYVWYSGNRAAHIGRMHPETGEIEKIQMPEPEARDPHTLVFDSKGDIWFTVQGGNYVGKLTVESREVELIPVPTPRSRPYGIVVDDTDRPWFLEFGSHKIGTVDPVEMTLTEIELPRTEARPRRMALTSDQSVWYVDYAGGMLGRYNPATEEFTEWPMPSGSNSRPYGVASDDEDRIWFVETGPQPNKFIGFDSRTEEFVSINEVESGGGTIRHMFFDPATRSIWFGADANTIGVARLGQPGS